MMDKLVHISQNVLHLVGRDSKTTVLSVSILGLFAWLILSCITQYFRLRHIPGPRGAGFSKWWLIGRITSGRTHLDYYEACEKYG
jgi:hypothetical protein